MDGPDRSACVAPRMLEGFRVLGLDLETTGFNPRFDRIVQYALVGSDADGTHLSLQSLVNPGVSIPTESTHVHGISSNDVASESDFGDHINSFREMAEGAIIVGHNVIAFDWRFIEVECARFGVEPPAPYAIIDTLILARKLRLTRPHPAAASSLHRGPHQSASLPPPLPPLQPPSSLQRR